MDRDLVGDKTVLLLHRIRSLFMLTRLHVYMPLCFLCTAVGLEIAGKQASITSLLGIGLANTFAFIFAFTFNDVEDAMEDAYVPVSRNPIVQGVISRRMGYWITAVAFAVSLLLSLSISFIAAATIFLILLITFFYSWRSVRLKSMPFWDIFAHALVALLVFLSSAWSSPDGALWSSHIAIIGLACILGTTSAHLTHQLYEYDNDIVTQIKTTASVLGKQKTAVLVHTVWTALLGLLLYAQRQGALPIQLIIAFWSAAGGLILLAIAIAPQQAAHMVRRVFPWAVDAGAISAIIVWFT
jgi:4-hydroxybenzoate polyprenyltransferase